MHTDYSKLCTCGNYDPYNPSGIVAATQPFGSCTNCYTKIMMSSLWTVKDNVSLIDELKSEIKLI